MSSSVAEQPQMSTFCTSVFPCRREIRGMDSCLNFFKKNIGCQENNVLHFFVILHRFTVLISTHA